MLFNNLESWLVNSIEWLIYFKFLSKDKNEFSKQTHSSVLYFLSSLFKSESK